MNKTKLLRLYKKLISLKPSKYLKPGTPYMVELTQQEVSLIIELIKDKARTERGLK